MDSDRGRRSYLALVGAVAGPLTHGGSRCTGCDYDDVVDVEAVGADPTGAAPVDDVVATAIDDDTLLEFPPGRYEVEDLTLTDLTNAGLRARGDAALVPAGDCDGAWIAVAHVRDFLFEGFTLDHSAERCSPTVVFRAADGLEVRDVRKRGYHDTNDTAFGFAVLDRTGSGVVENLRMPDGSIPVHPVGVYVQGSGTITFRDCHVEGFGNNGLYASMADGPVQVEGGLYRNNDRTNVRLGSADSYVRGARIAVTRARPADQNLRGVRVSDGPGPVTVEDCEILMRDGHGMGAIVNAYDGGSLVVRNTRVDVEGYRNLAGTHTGCGVLLDEASGADVGERRLEGLTVVGGGGGGAAVRVRRGQTTLSDCCIDQTGARDGIRFEEFPSPVVVADSTIDVAGEALVGAAGLEVRNLAYDGGCAGEGPTAAND